MVLHSPDWTNIGFSFILLTVNLFRHLTLIEHGLTIKPGINKKHIAVFVCKVKLLYSLIVTKVC